MVLEQILLCKKIGREATDCLNAGLPVGLIYCYSNQWKSFSLPCKWAISQHKNLKPRPLHDLGWSLIGWNGGSQVMAKLSWETILEQLNKRYLLSRIIWWDFFFPLLLKSQNFLSTSPALLAQLSLLLVATSCILYVRRELNTKGQRSGLILATALM